MSVWERKKRQDFNRCTRTLGGVCITRMWTEMELSPSIGVGEGVGAGDGDSANWSRVPRFLPSLDLAMTI